MTTSHEDLLAVLCAFRAKFAEYLSGSTLQRRIKRTLLLGADKSLARPGRKQSQKHVRDARDFNKIETRALIKLFFLQGKAPKEIHTFLTETLARFLLGRAKDLTAPLYIQYIFLKFILVINQLTSLNLCTGRPPIGVMVPEAV